MRRDVTSHLQTPEPERSESGGLWPGLRLPGEAAGGAVSGARPGPRGARLRARSPCRVDGAGGRGHGVEGGARSSSWSVPSFPGSRHPARHPSATGGGSRPGGEDATRFVPSGQLPSQNANPRSVHAPSESALRLKNVPRRPKSPVQRCASGTASGPRVSAATGGRALPLKRTSLLGQQLCPRGQAGAAHPT